MSFIKQQNVDIVTHGRLNSFSKNVKYTFNGKYRWMGAWKVFMLIKRHRRSWLLRNMIENIKFSEFNLHFYIVTYYTKRRFGFGKNITFQNCVYTILIFILVLDFF